MSGHAKIAIFRDRVADRCDLIALKFNELIAIFTMQVIMLGVAIVVFVDRTIIEAHFP